MNNLTLWGQGLIYFLLGALGPLQALYSTNAELSTRNVMAACIGGLISGLAALKAFMSTTYSDSGAADVDPKQVVVANPPSDPSQQRKRPRK
jgi:hypothetical protein